MKEYYTPTIEEFHVGFECEAYAKKGDKTDWYKWNFKEPEELKNLVTTTWHIKNDISSTFRVKYLDREDIESFGFTSYSKAVCAWYKLEGKWDDSFCSYGYWTKLRLLHCSGKDESGIKIIAYEHSWNEEETVLFQGQIKNKEELRVLLKQLKICLEVTTKE